MNKIINFINELTNDYSKDFFYSDGSWFFPILFAFIPGIILYYVSSIFFPAKDLSSYFAGIVIIYLAASYYTVRFNRSFKNKVKYLSLIILMLSVAFLITAKLV